MGQPAGERAIRCALRRSHRTANDRALQDYAARNALDAASEFAPHDDDELDEMVRAGKFDRVIFADIAALIECASKGYLSYHDWKRAGTQVCIANGLADASDPDAWLEAICRGIEEDRRRVWRRQVIGAGIFSVLALAALAILSYSSLVRG